MGSINLCLDRFFKVSTSVSSFVSDLKRHLKSLRHEHFVISGHSKWLEGRTRRKQIVDFEQVSKRSFSTRSPIKVGFPNSSSF